MKSSRHKKILELVKEYDFNNQDELCKMLNNEGFSVTQATVSRDINELNLKKIHTEKGFRYTIKKSVDFSDKSKYIRILRDGFVSMDRGENIIVIKTVSGMAMAVGAALDSLDLNEILGCIAGDDTVMCAAKNSLLAESVMKKLEDVIS